jgi:prevent-host-death family protein
MAKIIPIRDLRKGAEISEFVNSSGEPIFITRNGYGDMVIMSMKAYEENFAENYLYNETIKSVKEVESGAKAIEAKEVFSELKKKYAK